MNSSIISVGPELKFISDLGVETFTDPSRVLHPTVQNHPSVIVIDLSYLRTLDPLEYIEGVKQKYKKTQIIVIASQHDNNSLRQIANSGLVFKLISRSSEKEILTSLQEAQEEYQLHRQNEELLKLLNEQNQALHKLKQELEERVEKRQKSLTDSKQKLILTTQRLEAYHRSLIAIQRSRNLKEMEKLLVEALKPLLGIYQVRISYSTNLQTDKNQYNVQLLSENRPIGTVTYLREEALQADEKKYLQQISHAIELALDRQARLEESESLKQQWDATFDAIQDPIVLISKSYEVVRANSSVKKLFGKNSSLVIGKKCYEVFFERRTPCETCALGKNFELPLARTYEPELKSIHVSSHKHLSTEDDGYFVNIYRDVTEKQKIERRLLESAKLAELGTIGGSIAHELNNPIAGMLTFAQLIKMDLAKTDPHYNDILDIEKAILRCRDIVQNLLGFSRKSTPDSFSSFDLIAAIEKSIGIVGLQANPLGIRIEFQNQITEAKAQGQMNLIVQSLVTLMQDALFAVQRKMRSQKNYQPKISVSLNIDEIKNILHIEIIDDGEDKQDINNLGLRSSGGLGLTLAYQIFEDHGGGLEILDSPVLKGSKGIRRVAKISLPRPVF